MELTCFPCIRKLHYNDVIIKHFPRYWSFVWGIHRSPVNSPHKGRWRGALTFSLICAWTNGWANHRDAGDLRRHRAHCGVIVMIISNLHWALRDSNFVIKLDDIVHIGYFMLVRYIDASFTFARYPCFAKYNAISLHWCHNERHGVPNHQHLVCLHNRLSGRTPKKTSKLLVTDLCEGNPPVTGGFPSKTASNAKNISVWWPYHVGTLRLEQPLIKRELAWPNWFFFFHINDRGLVWTRPAGIIFESLE